MTQQPGYTKLQISLHWAIAGLVLFNFIFGGIMEAAYDAVREGAQPAGVGHYLHIVVGVAVLALSLVRIAARFILGAPGKGPTRGDKVAAALQGVLYLLTLLVPALGMMTWGGGQGWAAAPHVIAANAIMVLALVHALSALAHQFVLKDGLLTRMMRPR
ncbi:cytochrome b561 [Cereibacter ovatus]|uniref:Cytochrome b561 n=1 Tax=Cereibacter ovatus TaxID=439529 RepID=A0A285CU64_9RHOB|nr:cytochrome b/b6 domain-containing protein [Cereibacter ovatus]SNX70945.1 cytochrome b561 [Cereibacter ovatus]